MIFSPIARSYTVDEALKPPGGEGRQHARCRAEQRSAQAERCSALRPPVLGAAGPASSPLHRDQQPIPGFVQFSGFQVQGEGAQAHNVGAGRGGHESSNDCGSRPTLPLRTGRLRALSPFVPSDRPCAAGAFGVGPSSAQPRPNAVRPYVRRCWGRPGLPPRHPSFEIGRMSSVLSGLGIRRQDYSKAASNGGTPGAVHRVFTHRLHAVPRHGSRYIISRCRRASSIPGWVDSCRFPLKLLCLESTSER